MRNFNGLCHLLRKGKSGKRLISLLKKSQEADLTIPERCKLVDVDNRFLMSSLVILSKMKGEYDDTKNTNMFFASDTFLLDSFRMEPQIQEHLVL